jgi:RecB family exonuclease
MEPRTLSATSIKAFMDCPAHYKVQYLDHVRVASGGGTAGDLGSLLHAVLEWFVLVGRRDPKLNTPKAIVAKCRELAPNYGVDGLQVKAASKMLEAWHQRWLEDPPHEVLQVEVKETFPLATKLTGNIHETRVTYIWDRSDLMPDGSIKITDYKSGMKCLTADEIFHNIQVRLYALAAAIRYKDEHPPYIWVALDQLRYGLPTAVRFSRDDLREIWLWLRGVYEAILTSDGTQEIVGTACRWCVRSSECVSFDRAVRAGTVMSYRDPADAARQVAEINAVLPALMDNKAQLLAYLEGYLEERGELDERFENGVLVKITPKRNRTVDHDAAVEAVGVDIAARSGKLGVTVIDELLEGNELSEDQKLALRKAVTEGVTTSTNANYVK